MEKNGKPIVLKATLDRIVWKKDRRIIGIANPVEGGRQVGVIGDIVDPKLGQLYEFTGAWKKNEKYNKWDLRFSTYRTILPEDKQGLFHYLVRTAKWVGPHLAEQLLDAYGDNVLVILKKDPARVAQEIGGITEDRAKEIGTALVDNEKLEAAMIEVGNMIGGIMGPRTTSKAIQLWGANAAHIIRRDPHRLTVLNGVGFVKADQIYQKLGGNMDALRRHHYAAMYVLAEQAARKGHTILSKDAFEAALRLLVQDPHPRLYELCTRADKMVRPEGQVSDAVLHRAEQYIADQLVMLMSERQEGDLTERVAAKMADNEKLRLLLGTLKPDQRVGFDLVMVNPISILTGAPGTGKTYLVARIAAVLQAVGLRVAFAAPTGKAAKQMELAMADVTSSSARTIHSLLEPAIDDDGNFSFGRDAGNLLEINALVVDETSMVDVRLMRSLLEAVPCPCRVLFVGDRYQLPSVGPGAVLRDMIGGGLPFHELTEIKRHAGLIVRACHSIKDGRVPHAAPQLDLDSGANWRHIECSSSQGVKDVIERLLGDLLRKKGVDPLWESQIISPVNEVGPLSCYAVNRVAKNVLNPGATEKRLTFAEGDKVVRLKNAEVKTTLDQPCSICKGAPSNGCSACCNSGKTKIVQGVRIVNGDVGLVRKITARHIWVTFLYPERHVELPRAEHHLKLAYCMTCHKMQGSEVDVVILPIRTELLKIPMVTREWLYTAFSRAKKFIITVGSLDGLPICLRRVGNTQRQTCLQGMLEDRRRQMAIENGVEDLCLE